MSDTLSVMIIQPHSRWYEGAREEDVPVNLNLGILRVAKDCGLRKIPLNIIDLNIVEDADFIASQAQAPQLAILSVDIMSVRSACETAEKIRQHWPATRIMWTYLGIGFAVPFTLICKDLVLESPLADYTFNGDETILGDFLTKFLHAENFLDTPGLGHVDENGVKHFNPAKKTREFIEEDYEAVDIEQYIWRWGKEFLHPRHVRRQRILPISNAIGCPFRCTFCINSNLEWKKRYKTKSTETLLRQLRHLVETYAPDVIWFQDDNFFFDTDRAAAALDYLNEKNVKWSGQLRLNCVEEGKIDEDYFARRIAPGCVWLGMGFETFSSRLRALLNKKVREEDLHTVLAWANKYDVPCNPALIFGTVEQTFEEFIKDIRRIIDLHALYPGITLTYQQWRPYPGTAEFGKLEKLGMAPKFPETLEGWKEFDFSSYSDSFQTPPWMDERVQQMAPLALGLVDQLQGDKELNLRSRLHLELIKLCFRLKSPAPYRLVQTLWHRLKSRGE